MDNPDMNPTTAQSWFKKLAICLILATITTSIIIPTIAKHSLSATVKHKYKKSYGLFRPYAYWDFPYRHSGGSDEIIKALNDNGSTAFAQELKKTNFYHSWDQKGIVTIFVPPNEAFNSLDYDHREKVRQNIERILKYHIISKEFDESILDQGKVRINTLEGSPLTITFLPSGKIQINNNANVTSDTSTLVYSGEIVKGQKNHDKVKAVIIKIDNLLLPPGF
jgi:hypothetical protein